ncbi:50S ribosomal protein L32 [candidate division WWE3 bacterium CG08_land_8_20_14_0_20_40_13]|uniref:Large ribosomal subunit protein bL32 n=1 Tax=candidate division WWE3 bacterium CG08_land_8_20_14_0_20_40_13 TaxID=1975084 RepID=A0A2H0XDX9_UNCKA|nr:MAG: 50S ribosomal protein L32 [candidate division WWE3 bacterium CG08_land_8_20_14_0_20_40_13]
MAATPKRRISNTRRKHRRVNLKVAVSQTKPCLKCKKQTRPHTTCENCGTYNR